VVGRCSVLGHGEYGPKIAAAIAAISHYARTLIRYPRAIWDDQLRARVSDAQVAEVPYIAFAPKKARRSPPA